MNKKEFKKYVIAMIIAVAMFVAGAFSQGLFEPDTLQERYGCLSDCFLFPGVLLGGLGALTWIAEEGMFDMIGYGFKFFFGRMFHPREKQESFYEYKVRKWERPRTWLKQWFIVGMCCMGLSVIFLLLYLAQN